jgi:putative ABC transport system substrate-binding protein
MNRRTPILGMGAALLCAPGRILQATAQPMAKLPHIGVLRWGAPGDDAVPSLRHALATIGYVENRSIAIDWRFATRPDLARRQATELVASAPRLIVASAPPAATALRDATRTLPIVMYGVADPVSIGLVASLARPGGNVTGVSSNLQATVPKQMQLLDELLGGIQRVAFLGSTNDPTTRLFVQQAEASAHLLGMSLQLLRVGHAGEYEAVL